MIGGNPRVEILLHTEIPSCRGKLFLFFLFEPIFSLFLFFFAWNWMLRVKFSFL